MALGCREGRLSNFTKESFEHLIQLIQLISNMLISYRLIELISNILFSYHIIQESRNYMIASQQFRIKFKVIPLQIMNYWQLYKKPQDSFKQKTQNFIFRNVKVEPQQRNKLENMLVILNYALSYVIIFLIIMQSLGRQFINVMQRGQGSNRMADRLMSNEMTSQNYKIVTVLFLVRLSISVIYIISQKVVFLVVSKALLVGSLFMAELQSTSEQFIPIQMPLLLFQLVSLTVWAYKIQTRILHFDSRLDFEKPLFKDATVYLLAFLIRRVQKIDLEGVSVGQSVMNLTVYEFQATFVIMIALTLILFIDFSDVIYENHFKRIMLGADFSMLALLTSWLFCVQSYNRNLLSYSFVLFFSTIIVLLLIFTFEQQTFSLLYTSSNKSLKYHSQSFLIKYFLTLRLLIRSDICQIQNNLQIVRFIQYHRNSCLQANCPFTKRYDVRISVNNKIQMIEELIVKLLENLSKNKPKLRKFLIFYLSPYDKVFKYLNQSQSYMKRQMWRINSQKRQLSNQIRIIQAQLTKKQILKLIEQYLLSGKRFYATILKQRINFRNVLKYGHKMLQIIEQIQNMKRNSTNFSQQVRILINNFSSRLIQGDTQILQTVIDPPFLIHKTTEAGPTFLLSAQSQNFLRIIDANISCTKQLYFQREDFVKLTALDLLPQQIKVKHLEHFNAVSKKTNFDGKKDLNFSMFIFNKFGFVCFFTAITYNINSIKGRMWCVVAEIVHKMDSIIIVANQGSGRFLGISQMTVFHGLKNSDKDKQFRPEFFEKLKTKQEGQSCFKSIVVEAYQQIILNSQFFFYDAKIFQIIQRNTAFGLTYFLVQIKSLQQTTIRNVGTSLLKSQLSFDRKDSLGFIAQQQANFIPKKQLHFHSDGVLRFYPEKDQQILAKFQTQKQIDAAENEEITLKYDQDIVQMRLYNNNLDFIENMEQENQFLSKPKLKIQLKQLQLENFKLKSQFFEERLQQKKQTVPNWLKYSRIFFLISLFLLIAFSTIFFVYNNLRVGQAQKQQTIARGLGKNLAKYIQLSKKLIQFKYFQPELTNADSLRQDLKDITKQIQLNSKMMFQIDKSIQIFFSQAQIQRSLSRYLIAFNNILTQVQKNPTFLNNFNQNDIFEELSSKIVPNFNVLKVKKQKQFQASNQMFIIFNGLLIIGFNFVSSIILTWVIGLTRLLMKFEQQIVVIISKIKDKIVQRELIKLKLFQEHLYFDKEIYCEDDLEYIMDLQAKRNTYRCVIVNGNNTISQQKTLQFKRTIDRKMTQRRMKKRKDSEQEQIDFTSQKKLLNGTQVDYIGRNNEQEGNPYLKKLVNKKYVYSIIFLTLIWILLNLSLTLALYKYSQDYSNFNGKLLKIEYNINHMQTSSDMIWVLLNKFPNDQNLLDTYQAQMYKAEDEFKTQIIQLIRNKRLSNQFKQFYQNIWSQDCCQYLQNKLLDCRLILNGALAQGADQMVSYLNRKYDSLIWQKMDQYTFRNSSQVKEASKLQMYYMLQVININYQMLSKQHQRISQSFEKDLFIYYTVIIISLSFMLFIYKYFVNQNQNSIKVQRLLKLFEFQYLKDVKQFKLYVKQTYYDQIFK